MWVRGLSLTLPPRSRMPANGVLPTVPRAYFELLEAGSLPSNPPTCLVALDNRVQPELPTPACLVDPVEHVPRRAVLHAQFLRQLHGGDALAGRHHQVDGENPVSQGVLGGVHAGAGGDGKVLRQSLYQLGVRLAGRPAEVFSPAVRDRSALPARVRQPRMSSLLVGNSSNSCATLMVSAMISSHRRR